MTSRSPDILSSLVHPQEAEGAHLGCCAECHCGAKGCSKEPLLPLEGGISAVLCREEVSSSGEQCICKLKGSVQSSGEQCILKEYMYMYG